MFKDGRVRFDYAPSSREASSGDSDLAFVGLSPGLGEDALDVVGIDVVEPPDTAILYTPRPVSTSAAPPGTVSVTIPYGSEFDSADEGCELVREPTERADGLVECATPEIAGGTGIERKVRFLVPELVFDPGNPANVDYEATWSAGGEEATDADELNSAGHYQDDQATTSASYAGPANPNVGDPLVFEVDGDFGGTHGRRPTLTLSWDDDLKLLDTELPGCEDAPDDFGPAEVECVLPSGTSTFVDQTVTLEAETDGSKRLDLELVAENVDVDDGSGAVTVDP
jgi:hypothetical protein